MIEEEFQKLLAKEWIEDERQMIERIMKGMLYYKKLMPKSLKADVVSALQLCNKLKHQLEHLVKRVDKDVLDNLINLSSDTQNGSNDTGNLSNESHEKLSETTGYVTFEDILKKTDGLTLDELDAEKDLPAQPDE